MPIVYLLVAVKVVSIDSWSLFTGYFSTGLTVP